MAANVSSVNLIDLDFFNHKANLKNYLRNQKQYKDYDFDGSTMSVMLDMLSYHTGHESFYTNMLMTEAWLDTAQVRGSVISHAKELNYTPRSAKSAKARVKVAFEATSENQPYVIPKGTTFSAVVKNNNFNFSTYEPITISSANNSFEFEADIYEGIYVEDTYVFRQEGEEIPTFRLRNKNADTDSLTVTVYTDGSTNSQSYTYSKTLLDLDSKSQVYFLQADSNEYYNVYFGDNVLGKKPSEYSTIVLSYRLSSGPVADNALRFVPNFDPTGNISELSGTVETTTIGASMGGANPETKESIRHYAPLSFQVQERTVAPRDYEVALQEEFPEISAAYAYGGEVLTPPKYGRVYVAVDISDVTGLPESKKKDYENFLNPRKPFGIFPTVVAPDYSYLSFDILVRYNVNKTKVSPATISNLITSTVLAYRDLELNDFNVTYRDSTLTKDILESDVSIVSTTVTTSLYKRVAVVRGTTQSFEMNYNLSLKNDLPPKARQHPETDAWTLTSSPFTFRGLNCIYEDDGDGYIRLMQVGDGLKTTIFNVGTINYDTGKVNMNNVLVDTYSGQGIKFYVRPDDKDIAVVDNSILSIESDEINISVETLRL